MKTQATSTLPRVARQALIKLGEDIAVARKKRRISTVSMAERAFISRGTLYKVEKGDPSVSMGIYATVLSLLGLIEGLGNVADRGTDTLGWILTKTDCPRKYSRVAVKVAVRGCDHDGHHRNLHRLCR